MERSFPGGREPNIMGRVGSNGPCAVRPKMSDVEKRNGGDGPATGVIVKAKPKTKKPAMYKVLMLNDDYTPMEFVVHILERFSTRTARRRRVSCCMSIGAVWV